MCHLKIKMSFLIIVMILLITTISFAWGPSEREIFTWESQASYAVFNSIKNNPQIGDERDFVRIRKVGDLSWTNEIKIEANTEYEVFIYFHNNAMESLNSSENSGKGIAQEVKMYSSFPPVLKKFDEAQSVFGKIYSPDTNPDSIWDEAWITTDEEEVYLYYVPDTAIIHSNGSIDGSNIGPEHLFGETGSYISYSDDHLGMIAGGETYAGYVSYKFKTELVKEESVSDITNNTTNKGILILGIIIVVVFVLYISRKQFITFLAYLDKKQFEKKGKK